MHKVYFDFFKFKNTTSLQKLQNEQKQKIINIEDITATSSVVTAVCLLMLSDLSITSKPLGSY